ncbi:MAG: aminotransferase class V-fold PLP-dependent enzyme [Lachnospiraceae bacterium]|nr:aminotransferase class V-fold PLP-dependent enzyme [Lachnospiraceae bacterium]
MNTSICDFVNEYKKSSALRFHMPGHKGCSFLGVEALDITEIEGADSLYEAAGIIRESEDNAGSLFGCATLFSTEGSSQCIRAMLYLAVLHAKRTGRKPFILAAGNVHKTFLSGAALLDLDVEWMYPKEQASYLSCKLDGVLVEEYLRKSSEKPAAVYLTSPDYLGNVAPIKEIAEVCHRHEVLLLVDNAHGAYLKFLKESGHPCDLGADLCCDSAHKTLPVLTGGAYLHIGSSAPEYLVGQAKNALALFGSTSPSYLILQSLDKANAYLADGYRDRLQDFILKVGKCKTSLIAHGYVLAGDEPLKITICAKAYGYEGMELAALLLKENIVCEFADPDYIVFMVTPENGEEGLVRLEETLISIPRKNCELEMVPTFVSCERRMSIREAMLSLSEEIPVAEAEGRILAAASVGCPPAVPIVVCGQRISKEAIAVFEYYGIEKCRVVLS